MLLGVFYFYCVIKNGTTHQEQHNFSKWSVFTAHALFTNILILQHGYQHYKRGKLVDNKKQSPFTIGIYKYLQ